MNIEVYLGKSGTAVGHSSSQALARWYHMLKSGHDNRGARLCQQASFLSSFSLDKYLNKNTINYIPNVIFF